MLHRRPLVAVATALSALLLGAVALSGCSASAPQVAFGTPVTGHGHPIVAVVGDSIESGAGLEPFQAWPALVAVDRRWGVQNFSVPGAGFVAAGDGDETFSAEIAQAIAVNADVVLIGASDNDVGQDGPAVEAAMTAAVDWLHHALPRARLVGFSALTGEAGDADLTPIDDALRTAVTRAGGRWLDLGQPYRGQEGLVQDDGEHPTAAGQQAIASVVLSRLDGPA